MFLITTADQRFWKTDGQILFLGEWCKLLAQGSVWEKLYYEVLPYHWDDREKLYQDYLYLDKLYEQTLLKMRDLLNQIHSVDHSLRYWRIIIGPWLYYFIQILFDRYQSILTAIESGKVTKTLIAKSEESKWVPKDFPQFLEWLLNDAYNHYIYSRIIELTDGMPFDIVKAMDGKNHNGHTGSVKYSFALKQMLKKYIKLYSKFIPSSLNQIVLIDTYLSKINLFKLQLSLRQLPYLLSSDVTIPDANIDIDTRENLNFNSSKIGFEQILAKMIKEQIPLIYLESYAQMNECSLKAYPKKPKVIFTAHAYNSDESFKFWAGHHVDRGVKFVGTQHGGLHGIGLWYSDEIHEIKIYDLFYNWGWKSDVYKNIKPLAAAKLNNVKDIQSKNDGRILMALLTVERYSYHMHSVPVASSGMLSYNNEQFRFVNSLSKENKKLLLVRLYGSDYGWNQRKRWNCEFPEIECYVGSKSMLDQLKESRLFIGTYNGTTYLEAFVANFPTVIFWDPNQMEIRPSAQIYVDELKRVGIFHDTPESAAALINKISHDPASWWNQSEVQRAKDRFCFQFARTSNSWLDEWKKELNSLKKLN